MAALFGGNKPEKHPHFDHIAEAIYRNFALGLAPASPEVLAALDALTPRELIDFDNAHSIEGLQELFMGRAIRATVDPQTHTVGLLSMAAEQVEKELKAEHSQIRTMQVGDRHATQRIIRPANTAPILGAPPASATVAAAVATLPPSFEHLASVETLCGQFADLFVKYGQLTSADKEILKQIKPTSSTVEARVAALERWQAELKRRMRSLVVPKTTAHLTLGGVAEKQPKSDKQENPDELLVHRFEAIVAWLAKLLKEFEGTGVKYHNKPVWLH